MGALWIACPLCRRDFPVPASVTEVDPTTHLVTVVLDRTELYGHLQQCAARVGAPPPSPTKVLVLRGSTADPRPLRTPEAELVGRVHRMLDMRAYLARGGGRRACTMCGTPGDDCLARLENKAQAVPCCPVCRDGNTHPVAAERDTCAEWATKHGCKS